MRLCSNSILVMLNHSNFGNINVNSLVSWFTPFPVTFANDTMFEFTCFKIVMVLSILWICMRNSAQETKKYNYLSLRAECCWFNFYLMQLIFL